MRDSDLAGKVGMVLVSELQPGDSPRIHGEDEMYVRDLAELHDSLPPIVVHRATMRVVDGMHRLRAAKLRGDRKISVEFFDGSTEDAFLRAVHDNVVHGRPLSRADREAAARRIIRSHTDLSDRAIAAVVGLSPPTVGAIRRRMTDSNFQSNARVGRDGRTRRLNAVEGRLRASRIIAEQPGASLREVARNARISLSTAQDVRKRMNRGEDPVPARFAPRASVSQPCSRTAPDGGARVGRHALNMLRRDPSLRFSEAGRALLQWLGVYVATDRREEIISAIPEHCVCLIVDLARDCAEIWTQLGDDLDRRMRDSVPEQL